MVWFATFGLAEPPRGLNSGQADVVAATQPIRGLPSGRRALTWTVTRVTAERPRHPRALGSQGGAEQTKRKLRGVSRRVRCKAHARPAHPGRPAATCINKRAIAKRFQAEADPRPAVGMRSANTSSFASVDLRSRTLCSRRIRRHLIRENLTCSARESRVKTSGYCRENQDQ